LAHARAAEIASAHVRAPCNVAHFPAAGGAAAMAAILAITAALDKARQTDGVMAIAALR
jgi:hypothetical protein